MKIEIDVDITSEQDRLTAALNCKKSDLQKVLQAHAKAATMEYVQMFVGRASLRAAADSKEIRLLMMIIHVYEGKPPDEYEVSRVFHLTLSQARTLLKSVLAKYQFELEEGIHTLYVELIKAATQPDPGGPYEISVRNSAIVSGLNQILITLNTALPRIIPKRGTVGVFVVDVASHQKLTEYLKV